MKIGDIATTNSKGQLVIPAAIRAKLGITDQVPLHLVVKGNSIYITPIREIITIAESDNSYLDILKKTKGSWRHQSGISTERKAIELAASTKRKRPW